MHRNDQKKPGSMDLAKNSMTVASAVATAGGYLLMVLANRFGLEIPADVQSAFLVLGASAVAFFMRRGIEASKPARRWP